jgi:adenosylmethionine-8-amino-7-oxononanoate aminotransferase
VLVRNLVGHSLQISPPFVIEEEELALAARVLGDALDETAGELLSGGEGVRAA